MPNGAADIRSNPGKWRATTWPRARYSSTKNERVTLGVDARGAEFSLAAAARQLTGSRMADPRCESSMRNYPQCRWPSLLRSRAGRHRDADEFLVGTGEELGIGPCHLPA